MSETEQVNEVLQAESVQAPSTDKLSEEYLSKREVNRIVHDQRKEAYLKGKAEALAELQASNSVPEEKSVSPSQSLSQDEITRMIDERTEQRLSSLNQQQQHVQLQETLTKIGNELDDKLSSLEKNDPEIRQTLNEMGFAQTHESAALAIALNGIENFDAVVGELINNPRKYYDLLDDYKRSPALMKMQIKKLSSSLKTNQEATPQRSFEPLTRLRTTITGMDNGGGKASVAELRRLNQFKV